MTVRDLGGLGPPMRLSDLSLANNPSVPAGQVPIEQANVLQGGPGLDDYEATQEYERLINSGLSPAQAKSAVRVQMISRQNIQRPNTALSILGKVLGVGEAVTAGYIAGVLEGLDGDTSPWEFVKALGTGFKEIPSAVESGYTYEQLIRERTDPSSWLYKHALPIGLIGSIFADPTTYISFGSSTAARISVRGQLAASAKQSWREGEKLIADRAVNPLTGEVFQTLDEAAGFAHVMQRRPFTPGDLRDQQNPLAQSAKQFYDEMDLGYETNPYRIAARMEKEVKQGYRRFNYGEEGVAGAFALTRGARAGGKTLSAYLFPSANKYKQGVKFAGLQIPGTAKLGEVTGAGARAVGGGLMALGKRDDSVSAVANAYRAFGVFKPRMKLAHVAGDMRRGLALMEVHTWRDQQQALKLATTDQVVELVHTPAVTYSRVQQQTLWAADLAPTAGVGGPLGVVGVVMNPHQRVIKELFADEAVKAAAPKGGRGVKVKIPTAYLANTLDVAETLPSDIRTSLASALRAAAKRIEDKSPKKARALRANASKLENEDVSSFAEFWDVYAGPVNEELWFGKEVRERLSDTGLVGLRARVGERPELGMLDDQLGQTDEFVLFNEKDLKQFRQQKHPMQEAEMQVLEEGKVPIDLKRRDGLLIGREVDSKGRFNFDDVEDPRVAALGRAINAKVQRIAKDVAKHGVPREVTIAKWISYAADASDPIAAFAMFRFHALKDIAANEFMDHMLAIPMWARRLDKKGLKELDEADVTRVGGVRYGGGVLGLSKEQAEDFARGIGRDVEDIALKDAETSALRYENLPPGWEEFKWRGKRYAVASDVWDAFKEFTNDAYLDHETKRWLRLINAPQNWWKIYATSPNPAFHVMNLIGAVWNNLLAGIYNPLDYVDSLAYLYRSNLESMAERGERRFYGLGPTAQSTGKTQEAAAVVSEAEKRGGLGRSSFIFAETSRGAQKDILGEAMSPHPRQLLSPSHAGISKKRFAVRRTRQALAVASFATANPGLGFLLAAPEAAKFGKKLGGTIEDVVRLVPFLSGANDVAVRKVLEAYGPKATPGWDRWIKREQKEWSRTQTIAMYDIGAQVSKQFQFDYTDLTNFERTWVRMIFPFYTYFRKNFTLQAAELAKQPRVVATTEKLFNYVAEHGEDLGGMEEILPEYFDKLGAFQIPVPGWARERMGLPQDQPVFLNPKLPFLSLNLFPPFWELFRDNGTPTPQKLGEIAAPFLGMVGPLAGPVPGAKIFLEAYLNRSLGLNRPLDYQRAQSNDWRNAYSPAPGWFKYLPAPIISAFGVIPNVDIHQTEQGYIVSNTGKYILEQMATPFINSYGNTIPASGSEYAQNRARADTVAWITGIRLMPVDAIRLHRQMAYRLESMLEGRQAELRAQGKELDLEDRHVLKVLRRSIKVIERAYDEQEEEYYGSRR